MQKEINNSCLALTRYDNIPIELKRAIKSKKKTIFIEDYLFQDLIGSGTYAEVCSVRHRKTNKIYAMKIISFDRLRQIESQANYEKIIELMEREQHLLKQCDSLFVIKFYESFQNSFCKINVLEYCSGGTLMTYLQENNWCIVQNEAIQIIKQICLGVHELYKRHIMHRDLKLENILRADGVYKIIDLGFSKQIQSSNIVIRQTQVGTAYTMAPEVRKNQPYGVKVDIYSIGVIFLKLVVSNLPYVQRTPEQFKRTPCFNKNKKPLSSSITDVISRMTEQDPERRIGWGELLKHPVFKDHSYVSEEKLRAVVNQLFQECTQNSAIVISRFQSSRLSSLKSIKRSSNQHSIRTTPETRVNIGLQQMESNRHQNIFVIPQEIDTFLETTGVAVEEKESLFGPVQKLELSSLQRVNQYNKKEGLISSSQQVKNSSSQVTRFFEEDRRLKKAYSQNSNSNQSDETSEVIIFRVDNSRASLQFLALNSQTLAQRNLKILLAKKSQYILQQIIRPLQRKGYHILDLSSSTDLKLMVLLTQRTSIDLLQAYNSLRKLCNNEDMLLKVQEMQSRAKQKHIRYSSLLTQHNKSFSRKLLTFPKQLFSSVFGRDQQDLQKSIFDGAQFTNFTRDEQICLTMEYIQRIVPNIFIKHLRKKLLSYKKIMDLKCSVQEFDKCVQSILEKF